METACLQFHKIFLIIFVFFLTSSVALNQLQFESGNVNVSWRYLSASQEIEFEVQVKATGYVALGLTKTNSAMQNMDLFIGGVTPSGTDYLKDYKATGMTAPLQDDSQDYTPLSSSETNGITMVRCKRKLSTTDAKDLQIQPGDRVYIAWAYHSTSDVSSSIPKHSSRGYSSQMYELVPALTSSSPSPTTVTPTSSENTVPTPTGTQGLTATAPTTSQTGVAYDRELSFNHGGYYLFWKFNSNTNELFFKLKVKADGWVGLGISNTNSPAMKDMDVVVASVSGGKGTIEDYYSTTAATPSLDTTQDYTLLSATESAGTTTVEFKRKIDTGDNKDLKIVPGVSYYIGWAYHSSSDSFIRHSQRGYSQQKVVLVAAGADTTTTARTTTPTTQNLTPTTTSCSVVVLILTFLYTLIVQSQLTLVQ